MEEERKGKCDIGTAVKISLNATKGKISGESRKNIGNTVVKYLVAYALLLKKYAVSHEDKKLEKMWWVNS
jgi:hypothetical protein